MADAKSELLGLLDRKVFDPTIGQDPGDYEGHDRAELEEARHTASKTKESYHRYGSAGHIKDMFHDDLRSPYGAKQTKKLHDLGLPAFPDIADEFDRIAEKHHVR